MKRSAVILLLFFAVLEMSALPPQANPPLTKGEVMNLVKFGMSSEDLVKKIKDLGIDFDPTDDYLEALRKAGAQEPVIQALSAARPKPQKPLTREQVGQLVAGGVPSERATMLVKQRGIDFEADEEYLRSLRLAGADDSLVAALREVSKAVMADLAVETSPAAEVFLDGASQGQADAQGKLATKAHPGAHTLRVSLKGKKDFERKVTLAASGTTRIEARLEDAAPTAVTVRQNPKDGLKYVWVPLGTFTMGCSPGDNECFDNEKPAHQVTITRGFWIGQTPVTVGAYKRFADATGREVPDYLNIINIPANANMPITFVGWDDAQAYCGWMGGRLPTEAEWEYAARGGSSEARYGNLDEIAWYSQNSGNLTHDVAQKRANGFGLYDMLGDVSEWVNDWYDENYYQSSPSQDPQGPSSGETRVLRGGSWRDDPGEVRVSFRNRTPPFSVYDVLGFRCGGEVF